MNMEFDFALADEVKVVPIGMIGRVDSVSCDNNGPMYRIVYWNEGNRYSTWVYSWEIERIKK